MYQPAKAQVAIEGDWCKVMDEQVMLANGLQNACSPCGFVHSVSNDNATRKQVANVNRVLNDNIEKGFPISLKKSHGFYRDL